MAVNVFYHCKTFKHNLKCFLCHRIFSADHHSKHNVYNWVFDETQMPFNSQKAIMNDLPFPFVFQVEICLDYQ